MATTTALVAQLRQLVVDFPLRERFRAQLVLALYRSGRQAEALRTFDDAREQLVDELGVEPGRELQELHRAVLEQRAELDWIAAPDFDRPGLADEGRHRQLPSPTTRRHRPRERVGAVRGAAG